jgi:serine/threonine-protein kinase RsbW
VQRTRSRTRRAAPESEWPRGLERPTHFALPCRCSDEDLAHWIDAVESFILGVAAVGGLDEDSAFYLGVALREALMNAVRHGVGRNGRPRVRVSVRALRRGILAITVRDHGPGFDPAGVADPLSPENLGRSSGRGLFYMRRFTDRLAFAFPAHGAIVRLEKRLPLASLDSTSR